jgi:hypothetical protein
LDIFDENMQKYLRGVSLMSAPATKLIVDGFLALGTIDVQVDRL